MEAILEFIIEALLLIFGFIFQVVFGIGIVIFDLLSFNQPKEKREDLSFLKKVGISILGTTVIIAILCLLGFLIFNI